MARIVVQSHARITRLYTRYISLQSFIFSLYALVGGCCCNQHPEIISIIITSCESSLCVLACGEIMSCWDNSTCNLDILDQKVRYSVCVCVLYALQMVNITAISTDIIGISLKIDTNTYLQDRKKPIRGIERYEFVDFTYIEILNGYAHRYTVCFFTSGTCASRFSILFNFDSIACTFWMVDDDRDCDCFNRSWYVNPVLFLFH